MPGDDFDAGRFAAAFQRFLDRFGDLLPVPSSELRDLVTAHLGADPGTLSSVSHRFDSTELPNLQLALNALMAQSVDAQAVGLPAEARHYMGFSLSSLMSGRFHGPHIQPTPVEYVNVPIDVDRTLRCARLALYLLTIEQQRFVALVSFSEGHGPHPELVVEVLTRDDEAAGQLLQRLRLLMHEHNVYRGKVLSFSFSEFGSFGLDFHPLPAITRDDIVLPAEDLDAIERHTLMITKHASVLREAKRHLKRGLLLYGPPGTGKTLSVMYLCNRMPERTVVLLGGPSMGALGQAVAIARSLQPSMVVLEDVDLIARERMMSPMGSNPLLFQLLNEMDGLAEDTDVIFVLTTNRVDLLEPALAARPGRIDQAVEIKLPDAPARQRLFELYLRGLPTDGASLDDLVERTEGTSPALIKELVRRAALLAAEEQPHDGESVGVVVEHRHLSQALTDLLEHSAPVLKVLLGAAPASGPPPTIEVGPTWVGHTSAISFAVEEEDFED